MIQLETYKGTKSRHTCPACNSKGVFVRYQNESGEYISSDVGRCNRESKCGYHKKPKEYFAENPTGAKFEPGRTKRKAKFYGNLAETVNNCLQSEPKSFDVIAPEHLKATLGNYEQNAFVQFLLILFPDCAEEIQSVLKMYFVGTFEDYTCFPSIDTANRICRAKLIRFNRASGKRLKGQFDTSSLPAKLKLKEDFQYKQIFFGEHLLNKFPSKPVAVVESEKTAIIASLCFPEFLWLGCNSKSWLKAERLRRIGQRKILLYPDADGFELWQKISQTARRQGVNVRVSKVIEAQATSEQKAGGYDLADYLINQQGEVNRTNEFIDSYNSKLETVLSDECSFADFNSILDEQIAIAINNGLSEREAEQRANSFENARETVWSIA